MPPKNSWLGQTFILDVSDLSFWLRDLHDIHPDGVPRLHPPHAVCRQVLPLFPLQHR